MKEHGKVAFLIQVGTAPLCLERGRGKILINVWCEDFPTLEDGGIYMSSQNPGG